MVGDKWQKGVDPDGGYPGDCPGDLSGRDMNMERISTEAIQRFTSAQAWEYLLVPYGMEGDVLKCYGQSGRDYGSVIQEIEIIHGYHTQIEEIEGDLLQKILRQYYRQDKVSTSRTTQEAVGGSGFLMKLIEEAFDVGANDIHLEPFEQRCRVRLRVDGKLIERYVIEKGDYAALVNQVKILSDMDISEKRLPQDGRIMYDDNARKFDIRVSSLPAIYGGKVVMRLLTRWVELLDLANLGFTEKQMNDYGRAIESPHGLILICGPTGSGKSTTLYATLRRLNRETSNILTIEDPVEYTLEGVNQVQLKEDIGLTFAEALRTFLRQDPDIIMLGEIRDSETASMAIRSSLTGHLVFSTIHTNSAWGSVARLNDMGVHPNRVRPVPIRGRDRFQQAQLQRPGRSDQSQTDGKRSGLRVQQMVRLRRLRPATENPPENNRRCAR